MEFDTADTVIFNGEVLVVTCEHDGYLHTCGWPDQAIPASKCVLERKASEHERKALLVRLAESSGRGHRPACARSRLDD